MLKKLTGSIQKLATNNPISNSYHRRKRDEYMNKDFLSSTEYDKLFRTNAKRNEDEFDSFKNDAEELTENFKFRHFKIAKSLGSWRWKGVYLNREKLVSTIMSEDMKGIDFGGAYGPISRGATIVDFNNKDIFGRKVKYASLEDVDFKADYIFSSHTLEHIPDLDTIFTGFNKVLKPEGVIYLNLPAYSCARWRSGDHTNRKFNDHAWTFCLSSNEEEVKSKGYNNVLAIDDKMKPYFSIDKAEYTGDNSIFIIAKLN